MDTIFFLGHLMSLIKSDKLEVALAFVEGTLADIDANWGNSSHEFYTCVNRCKEALTDEDLTRSEARDVIEGLKEIYV